MSVSFPLTGLIDALKPVQAAFWQDFGQETSGQGSGVVLAKDLRPDLWHAKFTSMAMNHAQIMQVMAQISALRGSMFTFYAYNPMAAYPQSDPTGSVLGSAAVKINSLGGDNISLSLKGLPASYKLKAGDMLSFDYGSPSSRALHQLVENATANGAGVTPSFQVSSYIRTGAATDLAVTLIKPSCEMMMVPGSVNVSSVSRMKSQISFECIQVLH